MKRLLVHHTEEMVEVDGCLVLDASGINDIDATGVEMLHEVEVDMAEKGVALHLAEVKGPVRDVFASIGTMGTPRRSDPRLGRRCRGHRARALRRCGRSAPGGHR